NRMLGRSAPPRLPPYNFALSPYRAKKPWPPELLELPRSKQFNFERRFKRRLTAKSMRPKLNKWVRTLQWTIAVVLLTHCFWFQEWVNVYEHEDPDVFVPVEPLRRKTKELLDSVFWDGFYTYEEAPGKGRTSKSK
ncbi:hypothetical protein M011DRAFT_382280, partial [Sporormia fimetaria CBS 119925]